MTNSSKTSEDGDVKASNVILARRRLQPKMDETPNYGSACECVYVDAGK